MGDDTGSGDPHDCGARARFFPDSNKNIQEYVASLKQTDRERLVALNINVQLFLNYNCGKQEIRFNSGIEELAKYYVGGGGFFEYGYPPITKKAFAEKLRHVMSQLPR